MKIVGIIPARGKSKRLEKKNLYKINNNPLIAYTIIAAKKSIINDVYVSSEDTEILETSLKYGAKLIERPENLSLDTTPTAPVIEDAIKQLKSQNLYYDVAVLLQPTSPLRDYLDINNAIDLYLNSKAENLISVYKPIKNVLKSFLLCKEGYLKGIVNDDYPFWREQDLPPVFFPNGAIYIFNPELFLEKKSFFSKKTIPYEMAIEKSIDIDYVDDIKDIQFRLPTIEL